tara:strand:- start:639 stop:1940 length:1302 start_codon:yes stop_codon:yes gene_type:complete
MARAGGGGGGESAYNNQVCTLVSGTGGQNTTPYVKVTYTSATQSGGSQVTTNTVITGATSDTLTLKADRVGIQTVRCKLTHPVAVNKTEPLSEVTQTTDTSLLSRANSAIYTNTVNFETISATNQQISTLNVEQLSDFAATFGSSSQNLFLNSLNLGAINSQPNRVFVVYPPDENINVKIIMAAGAGDDFNGNTGGHGGRTTFTYTMKRNNEYAFKFGINTDENGTASLGRGGAGAYFYENGILLVACGGGGAAGWYGGNGGAGGGAGNAGANGSGNSGGTGGVSVSTGALPGAGQQASGTIGGKVESCTSGVYWAQQGYSPCSNMGTQKFREFDGSQVPRSASITRGYKSASNVTTASGWNGFRTNGGFSSSHVGGTFVGGGGSGAYGGNATGNTSSGGGGGSGYTNGAVTIVSSDNGVNAQDFSYALIELP